MKKILAFMLCISMLCVFPTAFAQEVDSSLQVLEALNIGSFSNDESAVTRGEFVDALSDILNYSNRPQNTDGVFSDVTAASDLSGAIYNAYERGLISGYADGSFGIDNPILFEHAVKILVSALGYDNMAAAYGGYPSGYMIVADQNRILHGVSKRSGDTLNGAECAQLIENAMNTPVYQQVVFGANEAVFEAFEGETLLSVYARIKKITGTVTDNGITSLSGKSAVSSGNVIINGEGFSVGSTSAEDFIGYNVLAYVTCGGNTKEEVLYITEAETVKLLAIPASRILTSEPDFSVSNIVYEDVYGIIQTANVNLVADCIYNGNAYFDLTNEDLNLDFGKIILIDNTGDGIYDVIKVEAKEMFLASGVNADRKILYTKDGKSLSFENSKNIKVFRDGAESDFSEISEWDVVSATVSFDKSTVTLSASSQKVSGLVDAVTVSDLTVSIGGKYYNVVDEALIKKIKVSSSYEFCLDNDMNIAGIKAENQNDRYVGILVNALQSGGVNSKLQVRIFSSLGNFDILDLSENVSVNGKKDLSISALETYILSNLKYKIISYKKNKTGEIVEINLPYSEKPETYQSEEDLRIDYDSAGEELSFTSPGNFDGKAVSDVGAIVFLMPADKEDYEDWAVAKGDYFVHSDKYSFSAYSVGSENGFSEYFVREISETPTQGKAPMVVERVSSKLNDNGEIVGFVRGQSRAGAVQYETKESSTIKDVKVGDVITYSLNTDNKITHITRMVDGENIKSIETLGETSFSGTRMDFYHVYSKYDTVLGYTKTPISGKLDKSSLTLQLLTSSAVCYEVDTKNDNKVTKVDSNAILPYTSVQAEYSRIFVHSHSGSIQFIVIYK